MTVPDQAPAESRGRKSFYFEDAFTDLLFLLTLTKHAFKGSEIAELLCCRPGQGGRHRKLGSGLEHPRRKD